MMALQAAFGLQICQSLEQALASSRVVIIFVNYKTREHRCAIVRSAEVGAWQKAEVG